MWRIDRYACKLDIYTYIHIYIDVWIKTKTEEKIGRSLSMDLHAVLRMRGELNVTSVMTRGCHKTLSHAWLPLRIVPLPPFTSLLPFVPSFVPNRIEYHLRIIVFLSLIIGFFFLIDSFFEFEQHTNFLVNPWCYNRRFYQSSSFFY